MTRPQWVGGQAVLEGVMMRHHDRMVVACRRGDNSISLIAEKKVPLSKRCPLLGWPILRGAVSFFESLILGVHAINLSAAEVLQEEGEEMQGWQTFLVVFLGLALGVGLFFILPTWLAGFLPQRLQPVLLNLAEGLIRLAIFLAYLLLITRWSEMKRFFAYHGAEHKAIFCYESGEPLDVWKAQQFSTRHPRCGTSFLLIVMVLSILLFSLFGWLPLWQRIAIRLLMLPLVAGLSYEVIRLTARSSLPLLRLLSLPGLWLQKLTTSEPDNGQVEVALCALKAVVDPDL
ncbi:MAG TPA: DUF1385 domain-containing protein [Bacillota bacterium]|jgi:uncharacterized protein YqhQ|nr:DUF1385 domain-containing protein [Bacillota bacterium]HOA34678.1 DUF1385 domain-containing protein [Bacillota bacterium]HOJ83222.1 DUF1385 domain-containing protein [Bacillota bacterium]HOL14976.1 DUF1385 domain-containing protein [Bacillota bacterium]HPZ11387.1 DUF1385 domain-containing protein [Bacillota bacterium]